MATCEYRRVNRSISKSATRSMAHLPGHCHRLHSADRLPVGPLLPGRHSCDCAASSATAPARPWPATPSAGSPSIRALRQRALPRTAGPRPFPGRSRPDRPGPPRDTPAAAADLPDPPGRLATGLDILEDLHHLDVAQVRAKFGYHQHPGAYASVMITFRGWLAKAARVVKGMDPVPDWHICVQGTGCRTVNARRKYSATGPFRSFSRPAHFVTVRAAPRRAASLPVRCNGLCVSLHGGLRPTLRRESPGEPCCVREIGPVGLRPS